VLDLRQGQAVHARRGDRQFYQTLASNLAPADPIALADAFRDQLGLDSLYVADLDAIEHDQPNWEILSRLRARDLWLDVGLRGIPRLDELRDSGVSTIIVATETLADLALLHTFAGRIDPTRLVLSVDMREGRPMGKLGLEPLDLVANAIDAGLRRILLLDLGRVGTGEGVGTLSLMEAIRERFGPVEITVGGGIGSVAEVRHAREAGASAALVGSALHDGRITRSDLESL
jgi:phosphoribosylformimino-5-aminoimidazole carboxamide ribotide isomerase